MILVPTGEKDILDLGNELIQQCRISAGTRAAYYRLMNAIAETGRFDGTKSLMNMLYKHLDRVQAHLFSPVELRFIVDFEHKYPKATLDRGNIVGETLARQWERSNTDLAFGQGVFEALKYGACVMKQWPQYEGPDENPVYYKKLVMPWQFGVYREDENELDKQEVICETSSLTMPEVWQRIYRLPNAEKLFNKIKQHAKQGQAGAEPSSFFHQILSTSTLNTGIDGSTNPLPGGIVQLNNDPNFAVMGPVIGAQVVEMNELWVKDELDYTTIQIIASDILVAPLMKKSNLFIKGSRKHPYNLIQPNIVTNWFWGRSELVDLIEPQSLLSAWLEDIKRMFGLQIDKILAFIGDNTLSDELYAQFRGAGYINLQPNSDVKDLTPKFPPEALPMIKFLMDAINMLGGFPEIMQGKGEQGVRGQGHADLLHKMASPQLRDRSLIVERQCATCADTTLDMMEAKDPQRYWTKSETMQDVEQSSFLLTDLPEDRRVSVDSHSSSPTFVDENKQLIEQLRKQGDVDGEYVLKTMPIPYKEEAIMALRAREAKQAELMKQHPELLEVMMKGKKH